MNWRLRLRTLWDDLQASLWFRPAAATGLAVVLAAVITTLDQVPYVAAPALLRIGAESARAVLAAIAGAMLAVVGLIFSMLMVALVLASQQFSPRILHNFIRDRTSQHVLSIFIGAFVYSLLVLARISEQEDRSFTPVLSVTGALLFALAAIVAFIYFIDHITKTIRVSYIIAEINQQTEALLHHGSSAEQANHPTQGDEANPDWPSGEARIVGAPQPGYIQAIDYAALVQAAQAHAFVIKIEPLIGDFVARASPLLSLWPATPVAQPLLDELASAFDIGTERTMFDDVRFGFRQLVDIALKAISPAVNDPTTAANCIDYLSNLLIQVAQQPDRSGQYQDATGTLRVLAPRLTFAHLLDLAFDQLRHYARSDVTITLRLLAALNEIAQATEDPERHAALWRHAGLISRSVARNIAEPQERQQINDCLHQLARRTNGKLEETLLVITAELAAESGKAG
jgi:uncharacterized membrane protein